MGMKPTEKIWHNGKLLRWEDATIHVLSHVVSYASAVFEGIRCYETKNGPAIFRVREHFERMRNSGKIYRMEWPYSVEDLSNAAAELVRVNKMTSCYIRPIALRGYGDIGVHGLSVPIEVYMACWEWGRYLGPEAIENGVDVCISSWNRMAPNTLPGITRNSVMTLCDDLKIPVREQMIPREMLYIAEEVFFTGTAAEITPLRSVDRIKVGKGSRGPITKALQEEFFAILTGSRPDRHNWLTPVSVPLGAGTR